MNGYLRESKELAKCLMYNRRLRRKNYPLEAVIRFAGDMTPGEHNVVWKKYTRNMKAKGIVAVWMREPTRTNTIHYHLILSAPEAIETTRVAIEAACPMGYRDRLRLHLERIRYQSETVYYVCKARTEGYDPIHKRVTSDRWGSKRLLFAEHVKGDKYGSIGRFWVEPKPVIWKRHKERLKGIALYWSDVDRDVARRLADLTGEPLWRVTRGLAYAAWRESKTPLWATNLTASGRIERGGHDG